MQNGLVLKGLLTLLEVQLPRREAPIELRLGSLFKRVTSDDLTEKLLIDPRITQKVYVYCV